MTTPQPGIFALGTRAHHHLELDLVPDADLGAVRTALGSLVQPHVTGGATNLVLGFGAALWARLAAGGTDPELAPFSSLRGLDGHEAPATQHDLWAWVHGAGTDSVLDTAVAVTEAFGSIASVAVDVPCFVYHDSRDLTGFIDGSANPAPTEAPEVACIPAGEPGEGGSHVITQRWVHDLDAFNALEVSEQERVFGRTKLDSTALPRDQRPENAHISLAEIHGPDGEEREIYRRSVPYGTVDERGLYFVAFSAERDRFDEMLARMFGTGGRTIRDRLLDFTRPVTGSYYFAPSLDDLLAAGGPTD